VMDEIPRLRARNDTLLAPRHGKRCAYEKEFE
jgi:hypothetical protein